MIINHNLNAMNAHRNMGVNNTNSAKSMEKLSSGLRINRAGDDAAGLAISEKMRGQIRGLDQASRNAQDGISLIQTAEGALNETHSILQRMRELAVQAGNDTNTTDDRKEIQKEINQLTSEINRIGNTTEFNTQKILDGGETQRLGNKDDKSPTTPAKITYSLEGTAVLDLATTNLTVGAGVNDNIKFALADGTEQEITLTAATYDGNAGTAAEDLVADIQAQIDANADLKAAGLKAELKDDKIVFTANEEITLKAGTNDVLADIKFTDGTKLNEVPQDTTENEGSKGKTFNANLQIGANQGQGFGIEIEDMRAVALGIAKASTSTGEETPATTTTYSLEGTAVLDLATTNLTVGAGVNDNIKFALADGTEQEITLTAATYDGNAGTAAEDLVADIQAQIDANADLKAAGLKAELKDDKIVFTANEEITLKAGTNDALADIKFTDGTKLNEVPQDTTEEGSKGETSAFTNTAGVSNGTTNTLSESALDISTHTNATNAIKTLDKAISTVSGERSKLGAYQNRLEHTIANLGTSSENLTAAESRIRDVDMAKEMMSFSKNNILNQAAQAMLAQANQQPQQVLQLLR